MTHWKKLTTPNFLGAYSLEDGKDMILTIAYVREETVTGVDGKKEDCAVCHFSEKVKPMILNSTNMKTITKLFKTPYIEEWAGKKIQIGQEKVKAFGEIVDALRVRNRLPAEDTAVFIGCEECGGNISAAGGMAPEQVAAYTKKRYGRQLCAGCAARLKKAVEGEGGQA